MTTFIDKRIKNKANKALGIWFQVRKEVRRMRQTSFISPVYKEFVERILENTVTFSELLNEEVVKKLIKSKEEKPVLLVELLDHLKKLAIFRMKMFEGKETTDQIYGELQQNSQKLELRLDENKLIQLRRTVAKRISSPEEAQRFINKIDRLTRKERK